MEEQKVYIYPKNAKRKLKSAKDHGQNIYIYGMTGFGKSELINHYLARQKNLIVIDAENAVIEDFDLPERKNQKTTVVIDQLQYADDEMVQEEIKKLLYRNDLWVILVSRAACPDYLMAYRLKGVGFVEISEEDLSLSLTEMEEYLVKSGIIMNEENLQKLYQLSRGHGMLLSITVDLMRQDTMTNGTSTKVDETLVSRSQKILWDYVEHELYDRWDPWLTDNIMRLSVVDSFDKELAEAITGSTQIESLLKKAMEIGNFITYRDGRYYLDIAVRRSMLRRMEKKYKKSQRDELYFNAGRYYRQQGQTIKALEMFKACGNTGQMRDILEEVGRTPPGNLYLYELRQYYYVMEETVALESPNLMSGLSMLYALTMNIEKSEYWYDRLKEAEKTATGSSRKQIKSALAYLNIALPHRGSKDAVTLLTNVGRLAAERKIQLTEFCVTGNSPSNMNGGKDFCEWSRKDNELAGSIGKVLSFVLGKHGVGLVDLALAESFFEKGKDDYEVIRRISKGLMKAESGKIEECFVGEGLLAKLHVTKGNIEDAREVLVSFRAKCVNEKETQLLSNIDNFLCQLNLYSNNSGEYMEWMEHSAPDEDVDFFIMERYRYLTKIRIYLIQGKYYRAHSLIERMLYYAQEYDRPYIRMECELLLAILQYRTGNDSWKATLQTLYEAAEDYQFVRILTKEAGAALELFEQAKLTIKKKSFYDQVMKEMKSMAKYYPDYLKENSYGETFSENALQILRLQAQGLSNEQIAGKLEISVSTVKYHCRENYQKLGVKSRVAAVTEAQKRKLI